MKYILFALFYQAIVAVNTAVILNSIIWMAKRKDEKGGRKPNPDFTPPPEKKPPAPQVNLCDNCRYRNQLCHKTGIRKCSNYIEAGPPKPPTTGTNVVKPKKRKYDKYSALQYTTDAICCDSAEAQKEATFTVYNLADESVKRHERNFIDAKCGKCKYFHANYAGDFGYCVRNDEIKHPYEVHGCFEK